MSTITFTDNFNTYTSGYVPLNWYGSCEVTTNGYPDESLVLTPGLLIGTDGGVDVVAPYPRADYVVPLAQNDAWSIEFKMMVRSLDGCFTVDTCDTPITLFTLGSMDSEHRLKIQATPDGYLQVYPYKTTTSILTCTWIYIKIEVWDVYVNVYVNNSTTPFLQYAIPKFEPFWHAGDNRIRLVFNCSSTHRLILDDFVFSTTATLPNETYVDAACYAIRNSLNEVAANASVFLLDATVAANQTTDANGAFSITNVPSESSVFVVHPDLKTSFIPKDDVLLAKQRRAVSGVDEFSNILYDDDGTPVAGARLYYIDVGNPNFSTDTDGRFARSEVPAGYNVFIWTEDDETCYLDSSLFS